MTDHNVELRLPGRAPWWPAALRLGWADLLGPLAIASVVVVVGMWLRTQGLQSLRDFDGAVGSLGLLSGLLATVLMILQFVLLARIPWIERAWGHDLLTHRHRWIGFASFWLMIAHVALYGLQRATRATANPLSALWAVFVTDSWMLLASIGTLMLIIVVVTSIRFARRHLRYESWHLLHLYAYLGMGLALPHQLYDGMHFHDALARGYWWFLYALALGSVLVFRLGLPIWRSVYHQMRVTAVTTEVPGVTSISISGHHLDRMGTRSGQFFIWRFLDGPGWTRGHPYTLSDAPRDDHLRVTIQAVGEGSARAATLKPGTRVAIEGPYGTMTAQRRRHARMLVVAAGVGITPLRAILADTPYAPGEAALIYRYSEEEHAIFKHELQTLATDRGIELHFLAGPRRADDSFLPANHDDDETTLRTLVPDIAQRDLFICGPPTWIRTVKRAAHRAGVHRNHIHTEDFAW